MKTYSVLIIGSGFGGQTAAVNLTKRRITNFLILERRAFMGGTWCQNTYPGAAVDVQSPLYSLSFEPYKWKRMFAEQSELKEYTLHVIAKYGLEKKTVLNTNVEEVKWLESESLWQISSSQGIYKSKTVINASGPLSTPFIPDFKGIQNFKGASFHTNSWDHQFDYKNKCIAVIGSGASAAQVIPAIVEDSKELHVFQRTPHWVVPRPDMKFNGFVQKLLGIKPIYNLVRWVIYWSLETRVIGFKYSELMLDLVGHREAKKHLKKQISDKALRDKLTPNYKLGCKRVILSNTLFPAFIHPHTTLHTKESGIDEITETGIRTTEGKEIPLDLIVFATGYKATDGVISYPVLGKEGASLDKFWEDYPRAYLGTSMPKFPNLFIVTGPNTGIGHTSALVIIEAQMNYIMDSITTLLNKQLDYIEVKVEAEEEYTNAIHKEMSKTVWDNGGCNSWYKSKSGKVIAMFPGFSFTYRRMARKLKQEDHILS
ncbi:MAG: cation diffusion facilitator CzcD-associated flavoprotein CzcO [Limisphaerales bacterium]|jgi:cation diffusion facilitator CzcD-associated flavoprotein CzcO